MTCNFKDNDYKMSAHITNKAAEIARATGAETVAPLPRRGNFGCITGFAPHHTGGAIMGTPTCTIGALAYWSANAITGQYLKKPAPLAHA